jgi:hypothetical protein
MTPTIDRRSFLGSLGAAAVASTLPRPLKAFLVAAEPPSVTRVPRVAVLAERGFPTIDASVLEPRTLRDALRGLAASYLEVGELERLDPSAFDVFLNPYGSAFPKPAWPQFHDFLTAGGNWVNVGGVPFAVPVRREAEGWQPEVRQSAYHKQLGITQAFPVDVSGPHSYRPNPDIEWTDELAGEISAETVRWPCRSCASTGCWAPLPAVAGCWRTSTARCPPQRYARCSSTQPLAPTRSSPSLRSPAIRTARRRPSP